MAYANSFVLIYLRLVLSKIKCGPILVSFSVYVWEFDSVKARAEK